MSDSPNGPLFRGPYRIPEATRAALQYRLGEATRGRVVILSCPLEIRPVADDPRDDPVTRAARRDAETCS